MERKIWKVPCIIAPSLIASCDLCNLEASVRELERAGMEVLHVDIIDGYFSPDMPLGLNTVKRLRNLTDMALDVHLMAKDNEFFVSELLSIGVDQLVFHIESEPHVDRRLKQIRAAGARAGVALKPATSLSCLDYVLDGCDAVLLMLINPGFAHLAGEAQVPYAAQKIRQLHERIVKENPETRVILDGRVSKENIETYGAGGLADLFVAGSTCLDKGNLEESARALRSFRQSLLQEKTI